jgi:hypothetical protein
VQSARQRLYYLFEPLEEKLKREKKNALEIKMKEVYGLNKDKKGKKDEDLSKLLHQKAILDLIRHGANIDINSQLVKGYMTNLPGRQFKDIDTQFIKEVNLENYKKWNMEMGMFEHEIEHKKLLKN